MTLSKFRYFPNWLYIARLIIVPKYFRTRNLNTYIEVLDVSSITPRETGIGAILRTPELTEATFHKIKQLQDPRGTFQVRLFLDGKLKEEIIVSGDTIAEISGAGHGTIEAEKKSP